MGFTLPGVNSQLVFCERRHLSPEESWGYHPYFPDVMNPIILLTQSSLLCWATGLWSFPGRGMEGHPRGDTQTGQLTRADESNQHLLSASYLPMGNNPYTGLHGSSQQPQEVGAIIIPFNRRGN